MSEKNFSWQKKSWLATWKGGVGGEGVRGREGGGLDPPPACTKARTYGFVLGTVEDNCQPLTPATVCFCRQPHCVTGAIHAR